MIKNVIITEHTLEHLKKQIEKVNKRARRISVNEITLEVTDEFYKEDKENLVSEKYFNVKVDYEVVKINGFKIVAQLDHSFSGGNVVRMIDTKEEIGKHYNTVGGVCEHCGMNRARRITYIIKNEDGEMKQIGKNCLKDYTGHDINGLLSIIEWIDGIERECNESDEEYLNSGSSRQYYMAKSVITLSKLLIDRYGYLSNAKRNEMLENGYPYKNSTSDLVKLSLTRHFDMCDEGVKDVYQWYTENRNVEHEEVKKAIEWILNKSDDEINSSYMHNLKLITSQKYISLKEVGYLSSLIMAYRREVLAEEKRAEEKKNKPESQYIGIIGEKMVVDVEFKNKFSFETMYGNSTVYIFEDENGNCIKWFTSTGFSTKDKIRIKFTVKSHEEYNGVKQTNVTRLKEA